MKGLSSSCALPLLPRLRRTPGRNRRPAPIRRFLTPWYHSPMFWLPVLPPQSLSQPCQFFHPEPIDAAAGDALQPHPHTRGSAQARRPVRVGGGSQRLTVGWLPSQRPARSPLSSPFLSPALRCRRRRGFPWCRSAVGVGPPFHPGARCWGVVPIRSLVRPVSSKALVIFPPPRPRWGRHVAYIWDRSGPMTDEVARYCSLRPPSRPGRYSAPDLRCQTTTAPLGIGYPAGRRWNREPVRDPDRRAESRHSGAAELLLEVGRCVPVG